MSEFRFSGLYGDAYAPEAAFQKNQLFAEQQKLFLDSVDQILSQQKKDKSNRTEIIAQLRAIAFGKEAGDMPSVNLMKLFTSFRDLNAFEDMARLYETTSNERFRNAPYVKEFLAVAYNKNGLATKALETVSEIQENASDSLRAQHS